MTAKSRANLKAVFENGDQPQGEDFEDLIDSFVSLTDTSANSIAGDLTVPVLGANTVSAGALYSNGVSTHRNPFLEAYADVTAISSAVATANWISLSAALTAVNAASFAVSGHDVIYTGSVTARFMVLAQAEVRGSANQNIWISIAKNGTPLSGSISKYRGAAELRATRTQTVVELKANDFIGLAFQTPDGPVQALDTFGVKYIITPIYWG